MDFYCVRFTICNFFTFTFINYCSVADWKNECHNRKSYTYITCVCLEKLFGRL